MSDWWPELLLAVALVGIVGGTFFVALRRRPGAPRRDVEAPEATRAPERIVERPAAAVVERPSLRERLRRSRMFLGDRLAAAFQGAPDEETWDDVEAALIQADVGVDTAQRIVEDLKTAAKERGIRDAAQIRELLVDEVQSRFDVDRDRTLAMSADGPTVWLVVGVNGTGKTTTIGKLAADQRTHGRSVALAAADTFRAAADEQLMVWAERTGASIVKHQPGGDPGAVAYDALQHARARSIDVLIVDTAGRLHTKTPLMDELAKVRRVLERDGSVDETLLVIDATAGQNGLIQARQFADAAGVTGIVLAKLDGTAKGGIALAIEDSLSIPIKLIGVGEGVDDLEPFDPKTFVDALLA
jgi:fused signal recognition particle receptor